MSEPTPELLADPAAYDRARQTVLKCADAMSTVALLGVNAWRDGREPISQWLEMLRDATDDYKAAVAALNDASGAGHLNPRAPETA